MKLAQTAPRLLLFFGVGFALALGQVAYWQLARADELGHHLRNPRYWARVRATPRGRILDARGRELAVSVPDTSAPATGDALPEGLRRRRYARRYPAGELCAHAVGYCEPERGESGVELAMDAWLTPPARPAPPTIWWEWLAPQPQRGRDVALTLDLDLQRVAAEALGARAGAVVALDVRRGAVLALADYPRFDPGRVGDKAYWDALRADAERPLLARAYQGLYAPGSTFKVLTMAAALDAGTIAPGAAFDCDGSAVLAHTRVKCDVKTGHGQIDATGAIARSCNVSLARTALDLGAARFQRAVVAAGMTRRLDLFAPGAAARTLPAAGKAPLDQALTPQQLAACGYGQGALAVSPLHLAALGQMLGNGGVALEPYLVERVVSAGATTVYQRPPVPGRPVVSAGAARATLAMMQAVMRPGGTGSGLAGGLDVAGKTGSAQNPHGQAHSWFLALAPATAPRYAVAVVVENAGWGRAAAGPVAIKVLRAALSR
jgi:peptidoglycan glycosyltransferase